MLVYFVRPKVQSFIKFEHLLFRLPKIREIGLTFTCRKLDLEKSTSVPRNSRGPHKKHRDNLLTAINWR